MVVIGDGAYSTATGNANHLLTQRRYPSSSTPVIKEFPHRATLLKSQENLLHTELHHTPSFAYKTRHVHRPTGSGSTHGRAPTIVSSVVSPTVTRKPSIQQKKRFMMSRKEVKNKFFYPVNGPKRLRSKRGKYRNQAELDASMTYIDFDNSMSKDLCSNQYVTTYDFKSKDLLKPNPKPNTSVKVITVDSKNNYILYTPDPTPGKNSLIADAEQILNEELVKLGKPVAFVRKDSTRADSLPQYRIIRPNFQRYDTFPITERPALIRTHSLPSKFNNEKLEALWNLYIRRVIAARIRWRLTHTSQEYLDQMNKQKKLNRMSMASSVDTGFFMHEVLREKSEFPKSYKSSPSDKAEEEGEKSSGSSSYYIQRPAPPPPEHGRTNTGSSLESDFTSLDRSPTRQLMLDSLEQLMAEVTSIFSDTV